MLTALAALVAALLLDGEAGGDSAKTEDDAIDRLSKLFDERIDAAFDRWLERKASSDPKPGDPPAPAPAADPAKPAQTPTPEPAKARSPLIDLVFGSPAHRSGS